MLPVVVCASTGATVVAMAATAPAISRRGARQRIANRRGVSRTSLLMEFLQPSEALRRERPVARRRHRFATRSHSLGWRRALAVKLDARGLADDERRRDALMAPGMVVLHA